MSISILSKSARLVREPFTAAVSPVIGGLGRPLSRGLDDRTSVGSVLEV
jgi:hypothetical protein